MSTAPRWWAVGLSIALAACSGQGEGGNDGALVGTWRLQTVNGAALTPGVSLTWVFTATTVTITSELDCVEVYEYAATGGVLSARRALSQTGTQCDPSGGDGSGTLGPYTVSGDTLTVTVADPSMSPPTAVFVFRRSSGTGGVGGAPPGSKWFHDAGGAVGKSSVALAADGTLYVAAGQGGGVALFAVAPDGTRRWATAVGGTLADASPSIAADGTIYIGTDGRQLHAIRPDGTVRWSHALDDVAMPSCPAIGADGTLYLGTGNPYIGAGRGALVAIAPDGTRRWAFSPAGTGGGWSAVAIGGDGTIYASAGGKLHAVTPAGAARWSLSIAGLWGHAPVIGADGTIYIASPSRLHAVSPAGALRWSFPVVGTITGESLPVVGPDGTIYQPTGERLHAVSPAGAERWSSTLGESVGVALGADGTLFVGNWPTPRLRAVDTRTGALKWAFTTRGPMAGAPAIGPDGTVYFADYGGRIHALDSRAGGPAASAWPMLGRDARHTGRAAPPGPP